VVPILAGITAVLETGWEMVTGYDPITRVTSLSHSRISKASQQQRRGRAGRTAPGTCYTLYSRTCYESDFPEYGVPEIMKSNLDSFLLGMLALGNAPGHNVALMDGEEAM
jgi:HrpA-like RNA helicase